MLLMETVQGPHLSGTLWCPESRQCSSLYLFSSSGTMKIENQCSTHVLLHRGDIAMTAGSGGDDDGFNGSNT